jgi:pyruvate dehydrogenase E1 component
MTADATAAAAPQKPAADVELDVLEAVQRRVLWLATSIVHHANRRRTTASGVKVGGHQASSASVVSIMSALYLEHLRAADRISVKPHAAPVLHAIDYLLGRLDRERLTELRAFGGLQSYPSRAKDPDPVDFSTGSVGIGATATIWSCLAHRYVAGHFDVPSGGRHVALVGDAELDEGAIWEALVDPMVARLGELLWIVDLNRQSLDRVVPDIAAGRIGRMFDAAGWQTITVKYGRRLRELFRRAGGEALHARIDAMTNEEYQRLLRSRGGELRERLCGTGRASKGVARAVADLDDEALAAAVRDLGGHDLADLRDAFRRADAAGDRPVVIFAYTIKAWGLPTEGHPANHSALLTDEQWRRLADGLGADADDPWKPFDPASAEAELCRAAAQRLRREQPLARQPPPPPADLGRPHAGSASTQQSFGRFFVDLGHEAPELARHVVTVSPDVASSTNLGGWINRAGVWNPGERVDWFADDTDTLVRWRESQAGQHIELGIAETNLVGLIGELGAAWSRDGQPLLPIGTLYDPFVNRALEPWSFGIYAGGQSILVGTPSGVTLAPEGGAHQSVITPSVGLEQPRCVAWEPAFGQDLEWTLLHALGRLGRVDGTSAYFRLSTRPIDQALAGVPQDAAARARRREHVLAGAYLLRAAERAPQVVLAGMGVVMPETLAAAETLAQGGIDADVVCVTSADLLFRALQARRGQREGSDAILDAIFPPARAAPIVTVLDGHPHTLSFLGGVHDRPIACLGVDDFGQSGDVGDLYRHFGIDADSIAGAARDLAPATPPAPGGQRGGATLAAQELSRTQRAIARRMAETQATVPDFQVQAEVAMDAAIALRDELARIAGAEDVPSFNDMIVKACALALRAHARVNGSYRGGRFELHERIGIGIAVAAPDALVVPTLPDADVKSLAQIARESRRLAERVRSRQISPAELAGATFTVSNLGMFGMTAISPVVNAPQAAILGVGALRATLARKDGEIVDRTLLTLTLTCDHRILYGADAAAFLSDVKRTLERPVELVL